MNPFSNERKEYISKHIKNISLQEIQNLMFPSIPKQTNLKRFQKSLFTIQRETN
jgi:hypothetical protein